MVAHGPAASPALALSLRQTLVLLGSACAASCGHIEVHSCRSCGMGDECCVFLPCSGEP